MHGKKLIEFVALHYDELVKFTDIEFSKKDTKLIDELIKFDLIKHTKDNNYIFVEVLRNFISK